MITIATATTADRDAIYRMRHDVYARELGQHRTNNQGAITDTLDASNLYLALRRGEELIGFVSLTPPGSECYSVDKYLHRDRLPFALDETAWEVRILTVAREHRGGPEAFLLMYGAMRWIESHGGERIIAIGRSDIIGLYTGAGLRREGITMRSGMVTFELMSAEVRDLARGLTRFGELLDRLEGSVDWRLPIPFRRPEQCYHGGAFFEAIGPEFGDLGRAGEIINADVLDAWFPPSPRVIAALEEHLPWIVRTSPPTGCEGLIATVARLRDLPAACVVPGAGSSDLIFRAMREWLGRSSRVLVLDPMYGEYAHLLDRVIGCRVERFPLDRANGYEIDPARLSAALASGGYDLAVIVNPNSPTGRHLDRAHLLDAVRAAPSATRIWIDETYVEYAGEDQSMERYAAGSANVVVCKSMSKVYALSGMRAAYMAAPRAIAAGLRAITPPWVIGLAAQIAAVEALNDPAYYRERYRETTILRDELARDVADRTGIDILPGIANFLLCHLPAPGPGANDIIDACRARGLFLRDVAAMGTRLGDRAIRIAVKDRETNRRIAAILADAQY